MYRFLENLNLTTNTAYSKKAQKIFEDNLPGAYQTNVFGSRKLSVFEGVVYKALNTASARPVVYNTKIRFALSQKMTDYFEIVIHEDSISNELRVDLGGTFTKELDEQLLRVPSIQFTQVTFYGKEGMSIHIPYGKHVTPPSVLLTFCLAYKALTDLGETTPGTPEEEFFGKLKDALLKGASQRQLEEIILDYTKDNFKIDLDFTEELSNSAFNSKRTKIRNLMEDCSNLRRRIEDLTNSLSSTLRSIKEKNEMITALSAQEDDNEQVNLIDFIKRCKLLSRITVDAIKLLFTIQQPIRVNDPDELKSVLENSIEEVMEEAEYPDDFPDSSEVEDFITAALIDEKFDIYTYADITINMQDATLYINKAASALRHALPNPHLMEYGCLGQHSALIANYLGEGHYESAIEQIIEAESGLNWADSPVVNRFVEMTILPEYGDIKCCRTKQGEWFSPNQYYEGAIKL